MKKKSSNNWNEEITISITRKKIFLQSFIASIILTLLIVLRGLPTIICFKHYICYIIPMIAIILLTIYLVLLVFYLFIVIKNSKK